MATAITGLSARREQQIQERQLLRFERRFDARLAKEISKVMRDLANENGNIGKRAEILANHRNRLRSILVTEWNAAFEWYGNRVIDALEKSGNLKMEFKEVGRTPAFDEAVAKWVQTYGAQKVTQIAGTTSEQAEKIINGVVAEGAREGWSEAELAKQLSKVMREQSTVLSRFRSRMIARTETHGAANAANQIAAEASGIPLKKEWVSAGDSRVRTRPEDRFDHRDANGQTVNVNESFEVSGEQLRYPGDPNGSAGNVIGCRCASVMVTA